MSRSFLTQTRVIAVTFDVSSLADADTLGNLAATMSSALDIASGSSGSVGDVQ